MKKSIVYAAIALAMVLFLCGIIYAQNNKIKEQKMTNTANLNEQKIYKAPAGTRVGHIHLKVSDIEKALGFYRDVLGFEVTQRYGTEAVFLSAGGYHHHIGLNTWHSKNAPKVPTEGTGMYHAAFLYPERKDLALIYKQLRDKNYPLVGAADHGVSEALYLNDPDGNGIELYWDKPREKWPINPDGSLEMYTKHLDLNDLLKELGQ
ncbi:MAG: VOC family protein [Capnocytophaga sp.]|nr:VOC family protein [Capnocytophaga sp.]